MAALSRPDRINLIERDNHEISLTKQAELLNISRSGLYYRKIINPENIKIRHAIDEIFTKHPFFGSRRMKDELENYQIFICRDKTRSHMRQMGLETIYPRKKLNLSQPDAERKIYPYLLRNMEISRPNQVWGTDITYVRMERGFCYLAAIMDWFSRFVIAWRISLNLEIDFCLENLKSALETAVPEIHNSDQGSQFTSPRYTDILKDKGVNISMDGRGRCMDNIFTERFWRTLKYEEVYLKSYGDDNEARENINRYIKWYNYERKHSSLGKRTPAEIYFGEMPKNQNKNDQDYLKINLPIPSNIFKITV